MSTPFFQTNKIRVLIVGTSLSPTSRSQKLAKEAEKRLLVLEVETTLLDLRENPMPLAGSNESWSDSVVERVSAQVKNATHILFSVPIYNYDVNAAAKNLVELVGSDGFEDKTVGFMCSAGGKNSYMSVLSFANSLMMDFRCWIVPRFVYVDKDFNTAAPDAEISGRIDQLISALLIRPNAQVK